MVMKMQRCIFILALVMFLTAHAAKAFAESAVVEASACDEKQEGFDAKTMEYRAVDKASLIAVKSSGLIQKNGQNLTPAVIDIIAYRLIDEYLLNVKHEVTISEPNRVCVKVSGDLEIADDELKALIKEHKKAAEPARINPEAEVKMAKEVAAEVEKATSFKPQSLKEKKLLFIENMKFWDGSDTNHYTQMLKEQFSGSDYYYVTDNKDLADFVVTPSLNKSAVDKIDISNHKMQMAVELRTVSPTETDFVPIQQEQTHFILFAADKDEQEIADNLIKKLLTAASKDADAKINRFLQNELEKNNVKRKK